MTTSFFKNLFHSLRYGVIKALFIDYFFDYKPNKVKITSRYSGLFTRYGQPVTNVARAIQTDVTEYRRMLNQVTRLIIYNNYQLKEFKEELGEILSDNALYTGPSIERDLGLILSRYTPDVNNPAKPIPLTTLVRSITLYGFDLLGYSEQPMVIGHKRNRHFNLNTGFTKGKTLWVDIEQLGTMAELNICDAIIEGLLRDVQSLTITLEPGIEIKHPLLIGYFKQFPHLKESLFFFSPRYEESNSRFCEVLEGRLHQLAFAVSYFKERVKYTQPKESV